MEILDLLNSELTRAADTFSIINPNELSSRVEQMRKKNIRSGFPSSAFTNLRGYGAESSIVIEPPSSDEDSWIEGQKPSAFEVADWILDTRMLEIHEDYRPCSYQKPSLIFFHLDPVVTQGMFWKIVRKLCPVPIFKSSLVDFATQKGFTRCGLISFDILDQATEAYTFFRRKEKESKLGALLHETPGVYRQGMVRWFVNRSYDPESNWYAVILRNLEKNAGQDYVSALLKEYNLKHVEKPRVIKGMLCTLAIMTSIEDAEKACSKLNGRQVSNDEKIRLHVHPRSNHWSRPSNSHHKFLNRACSAKRQTELKVNMAELTGKLTQMIDQANLKKSASADNIEPVMRKQKPVLVEEDGEIPEAGRVATPRNCYSVQEFPGFSYTETIGQFQHDGNVVYTLRPETPRPDLYPPTRF